MVHNPVCKAVCIDIGGRLVHGTLVVSPDIHVFEKMGTTTNCLEFSRLP